MTYTPKINDRVRWKDDEGWVYCITDQYFTLEVGTAPMSITSSSGHKHHHCLLCVYKQFYEEVVYLGRRASQYDDVLIDDTYHSQEHRYADPQ